MNKFGEITVRALLMLGILLFVVSLILLPFGLEASASCYIACMATYLTVLVVLVKVDFLG